MQEEARTVSLSRSAGVRLRAGAGQVLAVRDKTLLESSRDMEGRSEVSPPYSIILLLLLPSPTLLVVTGELDGG